jgi:hypothetical protein
MGRVKTTIAHLFDAEGKEHGFVEMERPTTSVIVVGERVFVRHWTNRRFRMPRYLELQTEFTNVLYDRTDLKNLESL